MRAKPPQSHELSPAEVGGAFRSSDTTGSPPAFAQGLDDQAADQPDLPAQRIHLRLVIQHLQQHTALESVTAYVSQNCQDYDFEYLKAELSAYRDDRPQVLLLFVEKRLEGARADFPNGYSSMNRAVIKGRDAANQQEAEELLDNVELKANDFPWLANIRTLAKAEIAHRYSQPDVESNRVDEFMARQPMLFEPDIALNFHLLRYQEHLKQRFQSR